MLSIKWQYARGDTAALEEGTRMLFPMDPLAGHPPSLTGGADAPIVSRGARPARAAPNTPGERRP